MNTPLFAVISAVLMIGSFSAGRATAPVVYHYPVTSAKVDVKPATVQKSVHVQHAAKKAVIHRKAHVQRPVNKAKTLKTAKVPHKAGKVSPKAKITLHPKQMAATHFDCTAVPDIAYQYPRAVVVKAAAEYLPKSSLLKLDYCLSKGGSG